MIQVSDLKECRAYKYIRPMHGVNNPVVFYLGPSSCNFYTFYMYNEDLKECSFPLTELEVENELCNITKL